ncbi:hypothetical protein ACF0H5_013362 [Mactra antiquata]
MGCRTKWTFVNILFILMMFAVDSIVCSRGCIEEQGLLGMINKYEQMEKHLQKSFDKLFKNFTSDSSKYTERVVYVCDKNCQDENRYEYGLTSSFLIAVMAEMKFSVKHDAEYSMFNMYEERDYSWKLNSDDVMNIPGKLFIPNAPDEATQNSYKRSVELKMTTTDFSLPSGFSFYIISGDNDWILDLRRNPRTNHKMPWLLSTHASDVSRMVHIGLLQPPRPFYKTLIHHLRSEVGNDDLICINTHEAEIVKKSSILEFLRKTSGGKRKFKVYLSNIKPGFFDDSDTSEKYFNDHVLNVNISSWYVDFKYSDSLPHNYVKFKNFVQTHILKLCNVLLTSKSAVGIHAVHLRINSDQLFCYNKGHVYKCTRELIRGSFNTNISSTIV